MRTARAPLILIAALLLALASVSFAQPAYAEPSRYIVFMKQNYSAAEAADQITGAFGSPPEKEYSYGGKTAFVVSAYAYSVRGFLTRLSTATAASVSTDFAYSVRPEYVAHGMLAETAPMIGADAAWAAGYTGAGSKVCIIDGGIDYSSTQFASGITAADFTHDDWCIQGAPQQTGTTHKYYLNISSYMDREEIGLWWRNTSDRYDLSVYYPNGTLARSSAGTNLADSAYGKLSLVNVTVGYAYGSYLVVVNYTSVSDSSASPVLMWGSSVATQPQYYNNSSSGCLATPNPITAGDSRAFYNNHPHDDTEDSHGTHLAGIVAKQSVPQGIGPGAQLFIAKVTHSNGVAWESDIADAINWCAFNGVNIILVGPGIDNGGACDSLAAAAVEANGNTNMLIIAPAGNSGAAISDPGCAKAALTVGAVDKSGSIAPFSAHGPVSVSGDPNRLKPELVAPGVNVTSAAVPDTTISLSGTSVSAAVVAGAAALLYQKLPNVDSAVAKAMLVASGNRIGSCDYTYGCGLVNASKALGYDFKAGRVLSNYKNILFHNDNSGVFDMMLYWREPENSHDVLHMGALKSDLSVELNSTNADWNFQHVSAPSSPGDNWNVTINPQGLADTLSYFLIYPDNYSIAAEYTNKSYRRGYTESVAVSVKNNNPYIPIQLSGIAVEVWNQTSLVTQLHLDADENSMRIDSLSTRVFTYPIYIPNNMPPNTFLKVRVFRRVSALDRTVVWPKGLEGTAMNESAARAGSYDDSSWMPTDYYSLNYPALTRTLIAGSSHGLVIDPFAPYSANCTLFANGTAPGNEVDWNGTLQLYSSCASVSGERENSPFESWEISSTPIVDPPLPPFVIEVANNTMRRGYFEIVNVSITNNQETPLTFDYMVFELYNTTANETVATLWSWASPSVNPLSNELLSFPVYVPDTAPIGPDVRLRLTAERTQDYNVSFVSLGSSIPASDALNESFDDSKWPVQLPKFATWHRRHLWADNVTTKYEFTLYHSYSPCAKGRSCYSGLTEPPYWRGDLTLYDVYNGTMALNYTYHIDPANCCSYCCSEYVPAGWSIPKLQYFGVGPNLLSMYIDDDMGRTPSPDPLLRRAAYPAVLVIKQYFDIERFGGASEVAPEPSLDVSIVRAGNGTLRRGYYEDTTVRIMNNNPVSVSLNSLTLQMNAQGRKIPLDVDGFGFSQSLPAGMVQYFPYQLFVPSNIIPDSLEAEAVFSYDMDDGWRRNSPDDVNAMVRYAYNDSNWVISSFSPSKLHRKKFFLPSTTKAIDIMASGMDSLYSTWNGSSTVSTLVSPNAYNDYFWQTKKGTYFNTYEENLLSFVANNSTADGGVRIRVYFNATATLAVNSTKPDVEAIRGAYDVNDTILENMTYPISLQYTNNLLSPAFAQTMIALQDRVLQRNEYLLGDSVQVPPNTTIPGLVRNVYVPANRRYFGFSSLSGGSTTQIFGCEGNNTVAIANGSTVTFAIEPITTDGTSTLGFVFKGGHTTSGLSAQWYINGRSVLIQNSSTGAASWSASGFTLTFMPCERFTLSDGTEYVYGTYFLYAPMNNSRGITFGNRTQPSIAVTASGGGFVAVELNSNACTSTYSFCGSLIGSTPDMVLVPVPYRFASEFPEKHYWRRAYSEFTQVSSPSYDTSFWPVDRVGRITSRDGTSFIAPPYTYRAEIYIPASTKEVLLPRTSALAVNGQNTTSNSIYQLVNLGDVNALTFATTSSSPYAQLIVNYLVPMYKTAIMVFDYALNPPSQTFRIAAGDNVTKQFTLNNTGNRALEINISTGDANAIPNETTVRLGPGEGAAFNVTFVTAGLPMGTHTATITAQDANAGTRAAIVSFNVEATVVYDFLLTPPSSSFSIFQGESASQLYSLVNTGNKPVNISLSTDRTWATLDADNFSFAPGDSANFSAFFAASNFSIGAYNATINADGGLAGTKQSPVTITVNPLINGTNRTLPNGTSDYLMLFVNPASVCYPNQVTFTVKDYVNEQPIPNALVRAYAGSTIIGSVATGDSGTASGSFPVGTYTAQASKGGFDISSAIVFVVNDCTTPPVSPGGGTTISCSIAWSPQGTLMPPGSASVTWTSANADSASLNCTGPIRSSAAAGMSGSSAFTFAESPLGNELCVLTVRNSTMGLGTDCMASLQIGAASQQGNGTPGEQQNGTNITIITEPPKVNVNVTAPQEVEIGSPVLVNVTYENGTPLVGEIMELVAPGNNSFTFILDANGEARYNATREGFYVYNVPDFNIVRNTITYAYIPGKAPETKVLVVPVYITEPSRLQLEILSQGAPQPAHVRIEGPMNFENDTNTIGLFIADIPTPGSYIITATATGVKSLSAQVTLNRAAAQRSFVEDNIWLLLLLVALAILLAYLVRRKLLAYLIRGRMAQLRIHPEKPKSKQAVEIAFTSEGKQLAGAAVTLITEKGDIYKHSTRPDGKFVFVPVEPGIYRISVKGYSIFGSDQFEVK